MKILIISLIALIASYFLEYQMDYKPCLLCLLQRYFYLSSLLLAALAISFRALKSLEGVASIMLMVNFFLALYHILIENHWISYGANACMVAEAISALPSCSFVSYFLGVPISVWNLLYSGASIAIIYRRK